MEKDDPSARTDAIWYEFRVWGRYPIARKRLETMASRITEIENDDWYLLSEDSTLNAKVRKRSVKLKRLVRVSDGFEGWATERFRDVDAAPEPFDRVIEVVPLQRGRRSNRAVRNALRRLDPALGLQPVHVRKRRRLYRVDEARAEYARIDLVESGTRLHSIVIEGHDLDELVRLRRSLGLRGESNLAVHRAIDSGA